MKLLAPSIHQDTSFTAMCALDGHSMQLGLQQQPAGRVSSCTLPGPDSCQLQLRSLSGGMTVPCSTQLQTPALLPPGWLPCLPSQLPAAAAPCPLLLGASVLSLPGAVSPACNNGTPCLPATCALPAVMTSTAADVTTAGAATRRQSSGGHETAAAGADSAEDSEEPDTPGSSDSWDSDYEAAPEPKRRGRPCTARPTVAIKHVQQQMQALARTRSTLHSRLAKLRALNEQLHTQLAALQFGWGEIQAANDSLRAVNGDLRRVLEHYGPQQPEKQL